MQAVKREASSRRQWRCSRYSLRGEEEEEGVREPPGRRLITIVWLRDRSHSLVLQLLRLQYFDDEILSDDGLAFLEAVDPFGAMSQEFKTLVTYDRCMSWWLDSTVRDRMDPPSTFMDRRKYDRHRVLLIGWLLACDGGSDAKTTLFSTST